MRAPRVPQSSRRYLRELFVFELLSVRLKEACGSSTCSKKRPYVGDGVSFLQRTQPELNYPRSVGDLGVVDSKL